MTRTQRGTIQDRPEPTMVGPGFRFVVETPAGDRTFVSDGKQWVEDLAHELWSLKYGEDLKVGDRIRRCTQVGGADHTNGFAIFATYGVPITEFCEVADIRERGDARAMILVRPDGEQVAQYVGAIELVQVAAEVPR